jgi:hypothetical protein
MARWGWYSFITEELMQEYMNGGSVTASPMISDVDTVDPTHGETIGHMLDLIVYSERVGGTPYFFRDGREATFRAAIRDKVDRLTWRFEQKLLNRLFVTTENSVGTSGYDVPFVHSTSGSVDFTPPAFGGEAFASTHDHYLGIDSGSYGYDDALNQMAEHLEEHGHSEPYEAVVARADIASYYALPDFVQPINARVTNIDRGTTTADTGAAFFSREAREFGVIGGFESEYGFIALRATSRVPTKYLGLVKSYGNNNERNPIAIRVHPSVGFGARIVAQSQEDDNDPIKLLTINFEFGVGIGQDRTNGVAGYVVSGGAWVNPTIS